MLTLAGRRPIGRLVFLVSMIGHVAVACGGASEGSETRNVALSGVGVVAEGCGLTPTIGSGVVLDGGAGDAVVVTVAHTIKGASALTVVDVDGGEHEARVVAFDKDADLAALDVSGLSAPLARLATESDAAIGGTGGSILTWSRDDGIEQVPIEIVKRLRVTIEDIYIDETIERTALEIAGPVTTGDSGGPVIDGDGDVVGIVYANSRGRDLVAFATDRREVADLLASVTGDLVDNGTCF